MGGEGWGPNAMCSVLCSTQSGRSSANQITATVPSLRQNMKTDEQRRWTGGLPLHSATVVRLYLTTTTPAHSPPAPANQAFSSGTCRDEFEQSGTRLTFSSLSLLWDSRRESTPRGRAASSALMAAPPLTPPPTASSDR